MTSPAQTWSFAPSALTALYLLLWLENFLLTSVSGGQTVYFDKYGHCQRGGQPFDLEDDDYTLKSTGGEDAHESLNCEMTFRGPLGSGICLTFHEFEISFCGINVQIFNSRTASGRVWRTLGCYKDMPSQMCTTSNYVTVKVIKEMLTQNRGYEFEIELGKSEYTEGQNDNYRPTTLMVDSTLHIEGNGVTADEVLFASIGVFVGIVLGVVLLIAILAGIVLYCCCYLKQRTRHGNNDDAASLGKEADLCLRERSQRGHSAQPSAPPADDTYLLSEEHTRTIHTNQPTTLNDLPPPYVPPPPYEEECAAASGNTTSPLQTSSKRPFVS